ncbi:carboxymuconolactone decarboxylase family protein [uncultured Paludibaculum sp.]|uniref:carboxymuconolactone decarboxylase family protein n=1 Tax=uncultured Paludibaculum sp. TaxID=1765020 RepID=UPI002AABA358|nr:carboxymuconolactone decarboxylase family protein [uncultured Paludibaculum sp.]
MNVQSVLAQSELTEQQTWTNAVACALACRNEVLSQAIVAEAATKLSPAQLSSAKAAFAIMQMNNIFYRFRHMVGKDDYANIPARLRMQTIRTHGGDPVDFELACLAVSTINGCEACVRSHEAVVREKGVTAEAVVASVRIASTLHAAASVIEAAKV